MKRLLPALFFAMLVFCSLLSFAEAATSDKYSHAIDMNVLSDYIFDGSKAQDGKDFDPHRYLPKEWRMHECPESLPIIGKAVVHVGDEGKLTSVRATFVPSLTTSFDYHQQRLDELRVIGFDPVVPQPKGDPNTAFYCMTTSEFGVVAYDDQWVAVWSFGGVDISRGMGASCLASAGIQYGSWKSGVYFIPRQYCYILDINNQIDYVPEIQGRGKATAPLMVKTTPDKDDYVKAGVYTTNQSFQVINAIPQNGHYQVYYKEGLYYVDATYVNLQLTGVNAPAINCIAKVNTDAKNMVPIYDGNGTPIAQAAKGATVDILQKNYGNGLSQIWFNTTYCYIETALLTDFQPTPAGSGITQFGRALGTLAVESPWSAYGQEVFTPEEWEFYKQCDYGHTRDLDLLVKYVKMMDSLTKIEDGEWVNVYNIEEISYYDEPTDPINSSILTAKLYTVVYNGNIRYIFQKDSSRENFIYYPNDAYVRQTVGKTQSLYVDTEKYDAAAYNIDGNNYFKLRDIAKMMKGTIKCFDVEYDAATNTIDMLSFFPYTEVGGELTLGDGAQKIAHSSSAFLTYDGGPIKATCFNIDGNNYFKLRDITDALDCRVEWDEEERMIKVYTSLPAHDDPNEPVG